MRLSCHPLVLADPGTSFVKGPQAAIPRQWMPSALRPTRRDNCWPVRGAATQSTKAFSGVAETRIAGSGGSENNSDFNLHDEQISITVNPHRDRRKAVEESLIRCDGSYDLLQPPNIIPVYVMLPLDTVRLGSWDDLVQEPYLRRERALDEALDGLRAVGVEGIMVDVWWGIVQHGGEHCYDFSAYKKLFEKVREKGLRVQAVMSFHAAGGNVGDICHIPLPQYVLEVGERDPDIFYRDLSGRVNEECLSLACDHERIFSNGDTPLDKYSKFITEFVKTFREWIGKEEMITEITVGMGPAGELRYPSYPEGVWSFPGIGEFQCYGKYMRRSLASAAKARADAAYMEARRTGLPLAEAEGAAMEYLNWGLNGPHNSGHYNSRPWEAPFFQNQGAWNSEYGHFFLSWYSGELAAHLERMLAAAQRAIDGNLGGRYHVLNRDERGQFVKMQLQQGRWRKSPEVEPGVHLGAKLAGIHWYYKTDSHAAELTAGYYNAGRMPDGSLRNGYRPFLEVLKKYGAHLSFTCVEMRDEDHFSRPDACCSPEALLRQVLDTAEELEVPIAGENALQRYDSYAFEQIVNNVPRAVGGSDGLRVETQGKLNRLTFLRMNDVMLGNFESFKHLMSRLNPNWKFDLEEPGTM